MNIYVNMGSVYECSKVNSVCSRKRNGFIKLRTYPTDRYSSQRQKYKLIKFPCLSCSRFSHQFPINLALIFIILDKCVLCRNAIDNGEIRVFHELLNSSIYHTKRWKKKVSLFKSITSLRPGMMLYIAIQTPVTKLINISNDMNILVYFPTTSRLSKENIIFNNLELDLRTKDRPSQIKYE